MSRKFAYVLGGTLMLAVAGYLFGSTLTRQGAEMDYVAPLLFLAGVMLLGASLSVRGASPSELDLKLMNASHTRSAVPFCPRLGEVLARFGLVSQDDLRWALTRQRLRGGRIGAILVETHLVSPDDVERALVNQWLERERKRA